MQLEALNDAQRRAVEYGIGARDAGPLLIIAGAGSGKTSTLACRTAHLIAAGADPQRILLLTFSRRAAEALERRTATFLQRVLGASTRRGSLAWAGTFHSVGARLLRQYAGRIGLDEAFSILDRTDAEDLLQEIFLAAHRKLDTFRGESALGTWLYRLATNLCLDHLRSRSGRSNQLTDSLDDEQGLFDTSTSSLAQQTVTKMDLERALARLPEGCRAAFVLHDVEGFGHQEVGTMLGISEGTSKSQVHKARMRIRSYLAHGSKKN